MGLALFIFRKIANFNIILLLLFLLSPWLVMAQCNSSDLALQSGQDLFLRKQYILSLQEFSLAQKFNCPKNNDAAAWGYLLALTELGERDEMFYLSFKKYPVRLSQSFQPRLKTYQQYYFPTNDGSPESQKVTDFFVWKENLPPRKSPAVAGTLSAFLPGAGQAYTGAWQSGALAFALNALFLSATLELADRNLEATALTSGVVFSIVYIGNILNATESAHIYNSNYYRPEVDAEKRKRFPELEL